MKYLSYIIILFCSVAQQILAQSFTVFGGDRQADFAYSRLDSINFSKTDLDSVETDFWQVQNVFTKDGLSRFALNEVDSITFGKDIRPEHIQIIPWPASILTSEGAFELKDGQTVSYSSEAEYAVNLFLEQVKKASGISLSKKIVEDEEATASDKGIFFLIDRESDIPSEGYILQVAPESIHLTASDYGGLFYGVQSLKQLLPAEVEADQMTNANWSIPCVQIWDEPEYRWRGYMKDVSRTFYSVDVLKNYIDALASYKMNVLHLHLTDDQGWRIEIKKYPKLTNDLGTQFNSSYPFAKQRSGYYTQEEIKDLVKYAQERNVTIVPEVDIPGHCWPLLLNYPELAVNDNFQPGYMFPFLDSWGFWGTQFTPNTLDPTKDETYAFLSDVFDEIIALFPSSYIHIGGDEVMSSLWEQEPHVKSYMQQNGFSNAKALQHHFMKNIAEMIHEKGRMAIGWNDMVEKPEDLSESTAVMSWVGGQDNLKNYTSKGADVVACPSGCLYLDIAQESRYDGTQADLGYPYNNDMRKIYDYDPSVGLNEQEKGHLLGIQANFWSHIAFFVRDMNIQVFPRLLAVSEISWCHRDNKSYSSFLNRLEEHKRRLDYRHIDYFVSGGNVVSVWKPEQLRTDWTTQDIDVSSKIKTSGTLRVSFIYTSGKNALDIQSVELLKNGNVVASDIHTGKAYSGNKQQNMAEYTYYMEVPEYDSEAKYTVRVSIKGNDGTDCSGNITCSLNPYEPFQ